MARQAPTLVSGRLLLETTTIVLAALTALSAFAIKTEAARTCTVPLAAAPAQLAAASGPEPETMFQDALLLGD